ncbi:ABC transporter permease [Oceanicella actignis]|uniref:ABC transporter permease n=1 Tax=Oceanicella actignis TaxID=1189325 RepID=UPI0011E84094|nr:ABC transporter permease [Oceanicella actignis]TYO89559.1 ABC-2 type transport system permease protein [Oceanicella actignis]
MSAGSAPKSAPESAPESVPESAPGLRGPGAPGAGGARPAPRLGARAHLAALRAIVAREALRFLTQRARFFAALVRPLVWLLVFAAGFRAALGLSITPPYQTYVTYEVYIVPGLAAMIQLFNGMQSSLSLVHDRETGSMRLLLTSPLPRWWLLSCKLAAGCAVSLLQVYVFLAAAALWGVRAPLEGYALALPALMLTGLMLGAMGLALSSTITQLENFAGVMNFVIFPTFFLSTALYPLWKMQESSPLLGRICELNPFTHAVELVRFALYGQMNWAAAGWTALALAAFWALAMVGYDPARGLMRRRAR